MDFDTTSLTRLPDGQELRGVKMVIIFDFDHTLFNANQLKKDMAKVLSVLEVTEEQFKDAYQKSFENHGHYHSGRLAKALFPNDKKLQKKTVVLLSKVVKYSKKYVYPDVKKFLWSSLLRQNKRYLLTFGDIAWQKEKLKYSGLRRFFHHLIFTDADKGEVSFYLPKDETVVFINDNPKEIEFLKRKFPLAEHLRIERKGAKYEGASGPKVPTFKNLDEINLYLKKNYS